MLKNWQETKIHQFSKERGINPKIVQIQQATKKWFIKCWLDRNVNKSSETQRPKQVCLLMLKLSVAKNLLLSKFKNKKGSTPKLCRFSEPRKSDSSSLDWIAMWIRVLKHRDQKKVCLCWKIGRSQKSVSLTWLSYIVQKDAFVSCTQRLDVF